MQYKRKIQRTVAAAALMFFASQIFMGPVLAKEVTFTANTRTREQITDRHNAYMHLTGGKQLGNPIKYDEPPDADQYLSGVLSDHTLQEGIEALNMFRYIAGLDDVMLSETYNQRSQAGSVVLKRLNYLTHNPPYSKLPGISDDYYELANLGTSKANLAQGYATLPEAVFGFMNDNDMNNLGSVGHRYWDLKPSLGKTGFGAAGMFISNYIGDSSNEASTYNAITWPAQGDMPIDYFFGYYESESEYTYNTGLKKSSVPWTVYLNPTRYPEQINADIKITITRKSDNKCWILDENTSGNASPTDAYLTLSSTDYRMLVFRPDVRSFDCYADMVGEAYNVRIEGLNTYTDTETDTLDYDVNFYEYKRSHTSNDTCVLMDDNNNIIRKINPETTVKEMLDNLDVNYQLPGRGIEVLSADGQAVEDNGIYVTNGMQLVWDRGFEKKVLSVTLLGDIIGDGKVNIYDALKANDALLNGTELTADQQRAADIDRDGSVEMMDILRIKNAVFDGDQIKQ